MSSDVPRIAITMGDPAGVGPEICLRLLSHPSIRQRCTPVVFGDADVLQRAAEHLQLPPPSRTLSLEEWNANQALPGEAAIIHVPRLNLGQFVPGRVDADTGQASYAYIQAAIDASLRRQIDAVATAPINKEAIHAAGIPFPGHTEMFAARCQSNRWCMMQHAPEITCTFVTVHVGYAQVPTLLTTQRILDVIELTAEAMTRLRGAHPKLVVCGLNPHAGEHGLFGDREEERIIAPAIDMAKEKGLDVEGPMPPDTAFLPWKRNSTAAYICMYHDQGHIPVKALAFDSAVNTTLGLPIIRTSVDHGTALDIAWQGKARPDSLFAAVDLAIRLAQPNAEFPPDP